MMDDDLVLSSAALSALAEFLAEKAAQGSKLDIPTPDEPVSIDHFPEDWQVFLLHPWLTTKLSQFWYDDDTAETLAKELAHDATTDTVIAIISAPSVYAKIRVNLSQTTLTPENVCSN
jgi:hypothetical protein